VDNINFKYLCPFVDRLSEDSFMIIGAVNSRISLGGNSSSQYQNCVLFSNFRKGGQLYIWIDLIFERGILSRALNENPHLDEH